MLASSRPARLDAIGILEQMRREPWERIPADRACGGSAPRPQLTLASVEAGLRLPVRPATSRMKPQLGYL